MLPPGALSPITVYRQPDAAKAFGLGDVPYGPSGWAFVVLLVALGSVAGGVYLFGREVTQDLVAHTPDVKVAAKRLDVAIPGQPATALVIGYDKRASEAKGDPSRSDTVMLVRADPDTKSVSLLSFPRDLYVQIYCPGRSPQRSWSL